MFSKVCGVQQFSVSVVDLRATASVVLPPTMRNHYGRRTVCCRGPVMGENDDDDDDITYNLYKLLNSLSTDLEEMLSEIYDDENIARYA
ncbi:jg12568 [Pararge aegeria aegeria]|uniref:Jg12568 protein n=1 Tax=Pararge aegeria aegeria TaxID=348720 RepID=A0A8S4SI69_9NEOP|nr:jg12568 [Pararge aegeria aegeria]